LALDRKSVQKAVQTALSESKGKRKFKQSVDLAINFKDVDFKKPENRLNLDIPLPHAPKNAKIAIFADGQLAVDAKKHADHVYSGADIASIAQDPKKQAELLQYNLLAQPQLMAQIGKSLGQFLGAKGKLPKPIMPATPLANLVDATKRTISIRTKGKYLPSVHCIIGKEDMTEDQLVENILTILENVERKIPEPNIGAVYVKTTMGKPARVQ
jgi:large subunit ribosomal protein L1